MARNMIPANRMPLVFMLVLALGIQSLGYRTQVHAQEAGDASVGFDQVRQILRKRCATCHNPEEARGDLDLMSLSALKVGSASGAVAVPGDPKASLLYTTAAHLEEPLMPPNSKKIPKRELDLIQAWIASGMPDKSGGSKPTDMEQTPKAPPMSEMSGATKRTYQFESGLTLGGLAKTRALIQHSAISAFGKHPGTPLVAVNGDRQVVFVDTAKREIVGAIDVEFQSISAIEFSADGQQLLVGGGTPGLAGHVACFELATGQKRFQVADETDTPLAIDLSPNKAVVATGGPNRVVRAYNTTTGELLYTLRKHTDWVLSLKFSPDGILLASGDRFGGMFAWSASDGTLFEELPGHSGPVGDLAWNADSDTLYSCSEDGKIGSWELRSMNYRTTDSNLGPLLSLDLDGECLVAGGRKGMCLCQVGEVLQLRESIPSDRQFNHVALLDENIVLTATEDGALQVNDVQNASRQELRLPVAESARSDLLADINRRLALAAEVERQRYEQELLARSSSVSESPSRFAGALEPSLSDLEAEEANLVQALEQTEASLQAMQRSVQELSALKSSLEMQLSGLRERRAQYQSKLENLEALENTIEGLQAQSSQLEQLLNELE